MPLRFRRDPLAAPSSASVVIPAVFLVLLIGAGLAAPWLSPQDPYALDTLRLEDSVLPPMTRGAESAAGIAGFYPLGTDLQGRDILSATLYGLRVSLLVGTFATLLAMLVGVALGLTAGYWRGAFDGLVMRVADIQLAFPSVLIALFLMAIWGTGLAKIIIAVAIAHWVIYARTVRGVVLAEREKDYIAAIRSLGAGTPRILLRHLLPNTATPVLVISAVEFASVVMLEATLSFLGLGVPITRPSLGMLIKFGFEELGTGAWWIWLFPGLTLALLVLMLNWLADALRARWMGESDA